MKGLITIGVGNLLFVLLSPIVGAVLLPLAIANSFWGRTWQEFCQDSAWSIVIDEFRKGRHD